MIMAQERTISVLHTDGNFEEVRTSAGTLNELLQEDAFSSIDTSNLKFTEGSNNTTLEHSTSRLPEGDFELFLSKRNSKAGSEVTESMEYKDIRSLASSIANGSEEGKKHMNSGGVNYTRKKRGELVALINEWNENSGDARGSSERSSDDRENLTDSSRINNAIELLSSVESEALREELEPIIYDLGCIDNTKGSDAKEEVLQPSQDELKRREMLRKRADLGI